MRCVAGNINGLWLGLKRQCIFLFSRNFVIAKFIFSLRENRPNIPNLAKTNIFAQKFWKLKFSQKFARQEKKFIENKYFRQISCHQNIFPKIANLSWQLYLIWSKLHFWFLIFSDSIFFNSLISLWCVEFARSFSLLKFL